MDPGQNPLSYPPVPLNEHDRWKAVCRSRIILFIAALLAVFLMLLIVIIPCVYIFVIKPRVTTPVQSLITFTPSTSTTINHPKPICGHRRFGKSAIDILYSFDCFNAIDEISGTYNGVPAALFHPEFDNETLQSLLPTYVTPDYSGQGAALKLNSSVPYQYIELERSPIFFNRTFTITAWLKPDLYAHALPALLAQTYRNSGSYFFAVAIVDRRPRIRVYGTFLEAPVQLKNSQWQHVAFIFRQSDLLMAIYIDGLLKIYGTIGSPNYGLSEIEKTSIGSAVGFSQYDGVIDQLTIAYREQNEIDILDEATLVVYYHFENDTRNNISLLNDASANSIQARGENLSCLLDNRRIGQCSLLLNDSASSYFQSSGFVLLFTHNYTYSYTFWISVAKATANVKLLHLTMSDETSSSNTNSTCLAMLVIDKIDPLNNSMQLSLYTYGPQGPSLLRPNVMLQQSTWYHLAVISTRNNSYLYLNGILVGSLSTPNAFQINNEQRLSLTIGNPLHGAVPDQSDLLMCHPSQELVYPQGSSIAVDELRFYARQLKPREIQALTNEDYVPSRYFFGEGDGFL